MQWWHWDVLCIYQKHSDMEIEGAVGFIKTLWSLVMNEGQLSQGYIAIRGESLLLAVKFSRRPDTHLIDLGSMKCWVSLEANQWFWTRDSWIGNPMPYLLGHCSLHSLFVKEEHFSCNRSFVYSENSFPLLETFLQYWGATTHLKSWRMSLMYGTWVSRTNLGICKLLRNKQHKKQ